MKIRCSEWNIYIIIIYAVLREIKPNGAVPPCKPQFFKHFARKNPESCKCLEIGERGNYNNIYEICEVKIMQSLYIIVPCYNEEEVLPQSAPVLLGKLRELIGTGKIAAESRLLFVDDGSGDATWAILERFAAENAEVCALKLSKNRGHQNAVMAGLVTAAEIADGTLTIDADLQDDVNAIDAMAEKWNGGAPIVCGVRDRRDTDTFLKRFTARAFYALVKLGGAKIISDHADFRLMSSEAVKRLCCFGTEDLFLRGLITRLGLPTEIVYYDRRARMAGESKYTLKKMLHLARRGFESGRMKAASAPQIGELYIEKKLLK